MTMVEWLLLGILVTSCVRLWFMVGDRNHVHKMNAKVGKMQGDWVKETAAIRKAELAELAELAKGSDTIRDLLSDIGEIQDNNGINSDFSPNPSQSHR